MIVSEPIMLEAMSTDCRLVSPRSADAICDPGTGHRVQKPLQANALPSVLQVGVAAQRERDLRPKQSVCHIV